MVGVELGEAGGDFGFDLVGMVGEGFGRLTAFGAHFGFDMGGEAWQVQAGFGAGGRSLLRCSGGDEDEGEKNADQESGFTHGGLRGLKENCRQCSDVITNGA